MINNMLAKIFFTASIAGLIAGCSGKEDLILDSGPAGPNTEKTLKSLSKGLLGDTEKANHTNETLEPKQ